ncbi:MAG: alpha/beta fold hydrolase [Clostridium sp.]
MRLLPESNGLYKVKKKSNLTKKDIFKRIAIGLAIVIGTGFLFQTVGNFIGNEKVRARLGYGRVDGKKLEFKTKGGGDYSVIFDGALGANLYEWEDVVKQFNSQMGVTAFTYNRRGYGFNDGGDRRTPEQQAEDLRNLLKKAGVYPPYILVGEEYGSVVLTNFAKLYPEEVAGVVLINPITQELVNSGELKKSVRGKYLKSKLEFLGSYVGVTSLMNKFGLATEVEGFEEAIPEGALAEYKVHKTKTNYRQAITNELKNLYKGESTGQEEGMFKDIPFYVISHSEDEAIKNLGSEELTTFYHIKEDNPLISVSNTEEVLNGIQKVLKEARRIEKRKKGQ